MTDDPSPGARLLALARAHDVALLLAGGLVAVTITPLLWQRGFRVLARVLPVVLGTLGAIGVLADLHAELFR